MKNVLVLIVFFGIVAACDQPDDHHLLSKEETGTAMPVSTSVISEEIPELSIFNLPATWTNQDNEELQLEELQGKVLVMVMIYTSCKAACPRLVADMRNIEKQLSAEELKKIEFILVSIDPETDTPQRLKKFATENLMDGPHWNFLRGTPEDTREFAAVLAVNYKKSSPIDFSHSNIISVFDEQGVLVHQKEGLGVDNKKTIEAIIREINN